MGCNTRAYINADLAHTLAKSPHTVLDAFMHPPMSKNDPYWRERIDHVADKHGEPRINQDALHIQPSVHADNSIYIESSPEGIREFSFDWSGPRLKKDHLEDGTRLASIIPAQNEFILKGPCMIVFFLNDYLHQLEHHPQTLVHLVSHPDHKNQSRWDLEEMFNEPALTCDWFGIVYPSPERTYFTAGQNSIKACSFQAMGRKRKSKDYSWPELPGTIQPIVLALPTTDYEREAWFMIQWLKQQLKAKNLKNVASNTNIPVQSLRSFMSSERIGYREFQSLSHYMKQQQTPTNMPS